MHNDDKLHQLVVEAQEILDRIISRFEAIGGKGVVAKTRELRKAAETLNDQLVSINAALTASRSSTTKGVRIADDIVFQLSVYDDICEGYMKGI